MRPSLHKGGGVVAAVKVVEEVKVEMEMEMEVEVRAAAIAVRGGRPGLESFLACGVQQVPDHQKSGQAKLGVEDGPFPAART